MLGKYSLITLHLEIELWICYSFSFSLFQRFGFDGFMRRKRWDPDEIGFLWKGEHSCNPSEVYLDLPKVCKRHVVPVRPKKTYQKADFFLHIYRRSLRYVLSLSTGNLRSLFSAGVPTTRYTSLGKKRSTWHCYSNSPSKTTLTMDFVERLPVEIKIIWVVYLFCYSHSSVWQGQCLLAYFAFV